MAACEAAERAVAEAAKVGYVWFEMLALADLLKWCAAGEAEDVRSRLRSVAERMAASAERSWRVCLERVLAAARAAAVFGGASHD